MIAFDQTYRSCKVLARRGRPHMALANKMARIVWAMMISGETYRRPKAA
jgi:hypothetical protein